MGHSISDVAKKAKVSPSTVSRILRNSEGFSYSEKTKKKVMDAVRELDYSPNLAASLFRSKRSNLVGVVVQPKSSYASFMTTSKLFDSISSLGYEPVLINYAQENGAFLGDISLLRGIICMYGSLEKKTVELCRRRNKNIPIVRMGQKYSDGENVHCVMSGTSKAMCDVFEYLYGMGHREIVFITYSNEEDVMDPKIQGYCEAVKKTGMKASIFHPADADGNLFKAGFECAAHISKMKEVTAAICSNDEIALGVMNGLSRLGISIPEDFSLIGYDDLPFAGFIGKGLTTVKQDFDKKAETAAKLLASLMEMEDSRMHKEFMPEKVYIECKLIDRGTAGPVKNLDC